MYRLKRKLVSAELNLSGSSCKQVRVTGGTIMNSTNFLEDISWNNPVTGFVLYSHIRYRPQRMSIAPLLSRLSLVRWVGVVLCVEVYALCYIRKQERQLLSACKQIKITTPRKHQEGHKETDGPRWVRNRRHISAVLRAMRVHPSSTLWVRRGVRVRSTAESGIARDLEPVYKYNNRRFFI